MDADKLKVAEIKEVEKDGLFVEVDLGEIAKGIEVRGNGGIKLFGREGGNVGLANAAKEEPKLAAGEAALGVAAEAEVFAVFLDEEAVDIFGEDAVGGDVLPGEQGANGKKQKKQGLHDP